MVATHRKIVTARIGVNATLDFADAPPVKICRITVLFITRDFAGAAAYALRHVEVEAVLLSGRERTVRHQCLRGFRLVQWCDRDSYESVADTNALM